MSMLLNMGLARILGPSMLGLYQYYLSIISLITVISLFGAEDTIVSKISKYSLKNDKGLLKSIHCFFLRAISLIGMFFLPVILLIINIKSDQSLKYIFALVFLSLLSSYEKFYGAILIGFKEQIKSVLVVNVMGPIFFLLILTFNGPINDFENVLYLRAVSYFLIISFLIFNCKKYLFISEKFKIIHYRRSWLKASFFVFAISLTNFAIALVDNYFLITFLNTTSVSFYNICYKISAFISFGLIIFSLMLAPLIQGYVSDEHDKVLFQSNVNEFIKINFIFSLILFLIIMLMGEEILALFGSEFKDALPVLKVLSLAHFSRSLFGPVNIILLMTNLKNHLFYITIIKFIIHLTLNHTLISWYGTVGVCISEFLSLGVVGLYCSHVCYKRFKINTSITAII